MKKRLFDIILSCLGLLVFLPVFVYISFMIKKEDGGTVFYRGKRVGKDGKIFNMFKFRTMVVDAENLGGPSTSNNDGRLTRVGRTLRRYKLDELPQLINVLKGDMSFVGPRPEVQRYTDMYIGEEKKILSIRPGITDWASIENPDEGSIISKYEDPDKAYEEVIRPEKIKLQLKYVKERTFSKDIVIVFKTVGVIFVK